MSKAREAPGPQHVPGWLLSANEAIERALLLVWVNVIWIALTLLGLVIFGLAPATAAAADALLESRKGRNLRVLPLMWRSYWSQWVRANTRILPLMAVQVGAVSTLQIVLAGGLTSGAQTILIGIAAAISLAWVTGSLAAIVVSARMRRQNLRVVWRIAFLMPGALPLRTLAMLGAMALWGMLCILILPLAVLVGIAAALDICISLLSRRIEKLLEEIDGRSQQRA